MMAPKEQIEAILTKDPNDYYGVLGVSPGVPVEKINGAYDALMQDFKPYENTTGQLKEQAEKVLGVVKIAYNKLIETYIKDVSVPFERMDGNALYDILGVEPTASLSVKDIDEAYRALKAKFQVDNTNLDLNLQILAEDKFGIIESAHYILREIYNVIESKNNYYAVLNILPLDLESVEQRYKYLREVFSACVNSQKPSNLTGASTSAHELALKGKIKEAFTIVTRACNELKKIRRPDKSQTFLFTKITEYLSSLKRDEEFIKKIGAGHCLGISILWAYSCWLQEQPNPLNKKRDDYEWFSEVVNRIIDWKGGSPDVEIERFIALVEFFQNPGPLSKQLQTGGYLPMSQQYLFGALEDVLEKQAKTGKAEVEIRQPKQEYAIAGLFTHDQLVDLFQYDIIKPGIMVLVESHNHATSIYRPKHELGGVYCYYFNPSIKAGAVKISSFEDLAKTIIRENFNTNGYTTETYPLGFKMFSMGNAKPETYPQQKVVLDNIHISLGSFYMHEREITSLHAAAMFNCVEVVKYFLDKKCDPNSLESKTGFTPLMCASAGGCVDVVEQLLQIPEVNGGLHDAWGFTALIFAFKCDQLAVAEILLASGKCGCKNYKNIPNGLKIAWEGLKQIHDIIIYQNDPNAVFGIARAIPSANMAQEFQKAKDELQGKLEKYRELLPIEVSLAEVALLNAYKSALAKARASNESPGDNPSVGSSSQASTTTPPTCSI